MKNIFWLAIAAFTVTIIVSCDKVEGPYKEENSTNIGSLPGTLNDIRVLNATTTSDDVDVLLPSFHLSQCHPKQLQFSLPGMEHSLMW